MIYNILHELSIKHGINASHLLWGPFLVFKKSFIFGPIVTKLKIYNYVKLKTRNIL